MRTELTAGAHQVEAILATRESALGAPGIWSFDFRGTSRFRPESLRVVEGVLLAVGPGTITFRLNGQPGERIRFDFDLGR